VSSRIDWYRERLDFYSLNGYISSEDVHSFAAEAREQGRSGCEEEGVIGLISNDERIALALENYDLAREKLGYPSANIWSVIERHYIDEELPRAA
jgi:uncharacterized protein YdbL (DUF1318 family)